MSTNPTTTVHGPRKLTRHDIMGIRYVTDPEAPAGGDPAPSEPAPTPAEPPKPTPPAGTPAPAASGDEAPPWKAEDFDGARAWRKIQAQQADLAAEKAKRDAAATAAAEAKEKELREQFGKALGFLKEDEAPTVEGLSAALQEKDSTLTTAQADNKALRIENAILRHADKFGGDADSLTDSEGFKKKLAALDPAADDHASQVEQLVKAEIEANPRFRKVQVAPSSGSEKRPTGTPTPGGPKTIDELRKERQDRRAQ